MTTTYRVSGNRAVCGVAPGGTLELDDETPLHVRGLLKAGHLARVEPEPFVDLEALTVPQLRDYADGHGIDLGEATRKADLVETISRAPIPPAVSPPPGVELTAVPVGADGVGELEAGGDA